MWDNNESRLRERISTAQEIELRSKKTDTTQSQQLSIQQHQQRINRTDPVLTFDVFGGEVHDTGKGFGAWRSSRRPMDDALGGFSSTASVSTAAAASAGLIEQHEYLDGFTTSSSSSSFSQDSQHQRFNNAPTTRGGIISGGRYAQAEHSSASDLRFEVKAAELPRRAYFHGLSAGNGTSGIMNGALSPISPLSSGFDYNSKDSSSSSGTILQHSSFQDLRAQSTAVFRFIQWHITHYYLPWLQKNADDILNAPKPVSGLVHDYSMPFLLREPGDDSFWRKTQQKFSALGIGYGGLSSNGRSGLSLSQSFPLRVVKRIVLPEPPQQQQPQQQQQQQQQQPQQQGFAFFTQPSAAPSSFLSSSSSSSSVVTNDDLATKLLRDAHAAAAKYGLAPMSLDTLIQNMVFMDESALEVQGPVRKEKKEDAPAAVNAPGIVSAFSAMPAFGSSFAPPAPPAPPPLPPQSSAWYVRIVEGRKTINRKITEGKSKGLETSPRKAVHLFQEKADLESFLWGGPGLSNSSAAAAAALGADAFDLRAYVLWRLRELVSDNTALSITTSHPEEDLLRPLADFMGDQVGLSSIKGSSLGISLASSSTTTTSSTSSSSFGAGLGALLQAASVGRPLSGAGGGIADGGATQQQLALLPSDAQIVFHYFVTMMDDLVAQRLRSNDLVRMQERILYGRALNHSASDHLGIGAGFADSTKAPSVTDRIASSVFVSYGDVTSSSHSRAVDGGLLSFNRNDGIGGSTLFSLGQAVRGHEPTRHASLRFRLNCRSEGGSEGGKFDAAVLIDGRPVLTTDPQDIGHGAKISLPRSLALWAQMQASQANGELAVHRNCVVNLQPELLSLVGML